MLKGNCMYEGYGGLIGNCKYEGYDDLRGNFIYEGFEGQLHVNCMYAG